MTDFTDWVTNGPPCLNCGERVPDARIIHKEEKDTVIFKGMCKSSTCRVLPPGGNPFMYILEGSE